MIGRESEFLSHSQVILLILSSCWADRRSKSSLSYGNRFIGQSGVHLVKPPDSIFRIL